ncbi:TPA: hypothetical protein ACK1AU_002590 [Staphylococcus aureus]
MLITTIQKLLDSNLSAFYISQQTGVDASSIQRIRSGKRSLLRLSLEAGEKLFNFQLQHEDSNTSKYEVIKTIDKLLNSDLSAFNISKETGVDASSIQRIRSGKRSLSRLSLEAGEKLFNFQLLREAD